MPTTLPNLPALGAHSAGSGGHSNTPPAGAVAGFLWLSGLLLGDEALQVSECVYLNRWFSAF